MGKGDKKTRRGKITMGSYGILRPRKKSEAASTGAESKKAGKSAEGVSGKKAVAKKAPKKVAAKKAE